MVSGVSVGAVDVVFGVVEGEEVIVGVDEVCVVDGKKQERKEEGFEVLYSFWCEAVRSEQTSSGMRQFRHHDTVGRSKQ